MSTEQQQPAAASDPAAADAALQGFLERAGLEASQVDGASLDALKNLLAGESTSSSDQQQQQKEPPSTEDGIDQKVAATAFPPATAAHQETNHYEPGFFQTPPAFFGSPEQQQQQQQQQQHASFAAPNNNNKINDVDSNSNAPPPPDLSTLTPFERYVVQQLQHQNSMIRELQRRVGNAEQQNNNYNTYAAPQQKQQAQQQQQPWMRDEQGEAFHRHVGRVLPVPPAQLHQQQRAAPPPPPHPLNHNVPQQQQQQQPAAQNQHPLPQPPITGLLAHFRDWLSELPADFQNSRTYQIWTLYMGLGRRYLQQHPQQIDPFLVLKVLFMLAILTSKMSRRSGGAGNKDGGSGWTTKFYVTGAVVMLGFLFQAGFMTFSYNFWIRRDYARRIWAGEDITLEQAIAEEAAVAQEPAAAEQQGGWRQTFLFGGRVNVAAAPQQQSLAARALGLLQDILFFFGSFVLSIFPMWRAAPLARPVPAGDGDANNEAAGAGAGAVADPAGGGPGVVAPPVDPAGPEEEEEDAPPEERG